ncbi:unnamed protein product [Symbiodinium natans]|uniref:Uncharacterized protein n=1 Tax=Symbiodinium natans TaxID=878477 RepID=A0A812QQD0_9DINO|nr:unnamed protein product [Symbiodinium natans]
MDIADDAACRKRKVKWQSLEDGDYIVGVSGYSSNAIQDKYYLAHTVTLRTRRGKVMSFAGKRRQKKGKPFAEMKADYTYEICRLIFSEGSVIGALQRPLFGNPVQFEVTENCDLGFRCPTVPKQDGIELALGGWAQQHGLRWSDRIVRVNGALTREMESAEELETALQARPLRMTFVQYIPRRATKVEELLQVKLAKGSAALDACNRAMMQEGQATPPSTKTQCQADSNKSKWNRRLKKSRLPNMHELLTQPNSYHQPASTPVTALAQTVRLPVPPFDDAACGGPSEWNLADTASAASPERVLTWGAAARHQLSQPHCPAASISDVDGFLNSFFETRPGPYGRSLRDLLGEPEQKANGWYKVPWKPFEKFQLREGDWQRGWHGCKLEALYSIVYHGELFPSKDESKGDRILAGCPGVYLHRDSLQHKVENYMRWIPMCGDGLFWAAKWEVFYDSWGSVKRGKRTDQIIQSADSVELKALWLSVQCAATMAEGTPIQALWRPRREANPTLTKAQRRTHGAMLDWEPQEEVLALCDVPVPVKEPQEVPQDISHWPSLGEANDIDRSIATAKRLGSITRKQSPCARRTASSSPSSTPPSAAMPDPICEEAVPVPRRWDKTRIVSQA